MVILLLLLLLLRPEALSLKGSSSILYNYDLLILLSIFEAFPILPFLLFLLSRSRNWLMINIFESPFSNI